MRTVALLTLLALAIGTTAIAQRDGTAQAPRNRQAPAQTRTQQAEPQREQHRLTGDMQKDMRMMNDMMVEHLGEHDDEFELRFIDMMIPHHEGAIRMAKQALEHSSRPELKEMAKKAIAQQEKEIKQLKQWREEWYGKEKR